MTVTAHVLFVLRQSNGDYFALVRAIDIFIHYVWSRLSIAFFWRTIQVLLQLCRDNLNRYIWLHPFVPLLYNLLVCRSSGHRTNLRLILDPLVWIVNRCNWLAYSTIFELVILILLGFPSELKFELLILHMNFIFMNIMAQILHIRLFLWYYFLVLPKITTARVCCIPCWLLGSFSEKSTLYRYDNRRVVNVRLISWFLFIIGGAYLKVRGFLSGCGRLLINTRKKVSMALAW